MTIPEQIKRTDVVISSLVDILLNTNKNTTDYIRVQNQLNLVCKHRTFLLKRG